MKVYDVLDLTDLPPGAVIGKHAVWLPPVDHRGLYGIKVPFQFGGRVQKYRHPTEATYDLETIGTEYTLLMWLALQRCAAPLGDWVYFKTVVSDHLGTWWADPRGAYGWEMADASRMRTAGKATPEVLRAMRSAGDVSGSAGAWSDLMHPDRNNIINGYVIDVRRSGFDCLKLGAATVKHSVPVYEEDTAALLSDLRRDGQFPFRERDLPYQEVLVNGAWQAGEREVRKRAGVLTFIPGTGSSVLDLGTCTGGFLQHAHTLGASRLVGIDSQPEFVDLARRLARAAGMNICYRQMDLTHLAFDDFRWFDAVFPKGVDHLLALSMGKHVTEERLWTLIDILKADRTYLETNAVKDPPYPLAAGVVARNGVMTGFTEDRNRRAGYLVCRDALSR